MATHRRRERTPKSGLARSRKWSTGPRKVLKDHCSRSSRPPASPPQHSRRGEQEIVGAVKSGPAEEQQGSRRQCTGPKRGEQEIAGAVGPGTAEARQDSRRRNTGPNRGEENRRSGNDRPRASPPRNNHREERGSWALPGLAPLRRSAAHEVRAPCPEKVRRNTEAGVIDRGRPLHEITTKESRGSRALSGPFLRGRSEPPHDKNCSKCAHRSRRHRATWGSLRPWRASAPL
ncbi:hypothetical protein NDU88_005650 [Pleurodeles waltl]|uniref:Uncharacterized protein n=1 Tax=Pleurodeles waltl TaxID=8319 RepID=A0AAV7RMN8_PLEWA|nr:hypothetical protein NDU88_005650 [Pleurodeles waltl]